jgi:2-polyprenyl-3-methyl-5-hydroxy-6-metoxy-1,4-benzoquinol methylase
MIPCDICGDNKPEPVLECARLDGPLVRCQTCGLYYVGQRSSNLVYGSSPAAEVAARAQAANARFRSLRLEDEHRLALRNARERLDYIKRFRPSGKMLEVGCGRGDFLQVARDYFTVFGVEPNPELAGIAGEFAPVRQGTIDDETGRYYDVAVSFHVLEHVDSPTRFLASIGERLRSGGVLAIETPDIDSLPFRILKKRWRQFIPEHYFFFDEGTLRRLLEKAGYKVIKVDHVGKYASVGLILNRMSRHFWPLRYLEDLAHWSRLSSWSFHIDPMDIMIVIASKSDAAAELTPGEAKPAATPSGKQ